MGTHLNICNENEYQTHILCHAVTYFAFKAMLSWFYKTVDDISMA